jgi:hypothetical protein
LQKGRQGSWNLLCVLSSCPFFGLTALNPGNDGPVAKQRLDEGFTMVNVATDIVAMSSGIAKNVEEALSTSIEVKSGYTMVQTGSRTS